MYLIEVQMLNDAGNSLVSFPVDTQSSNNIRKITGHMGIELHKNEKEM